MKPNGVPPMARRLHDTARWRGRALLALAASLLALGGCTAQRDLRKVELAELVGWLPGQYDNKEQVARDAQNGKPLHTALALALLRIDAPYVGDHVFYSQEMAADDPRRVTAQRVLAFDVADDAKIVQRTYLLNEPARWRDGQLDPDLFKSLTLPDVKNLAGCELVWTKSGERFTGANNRQTCRTSSRLTGESVLTEMRAELGPAELFLGERAYSLSGEPVGADAEQALYRFQKRHE
jgi:hypothetical protein